MGTEASDPKEVVVDGRLSSTPGRGCMVEWICRWQGGAVPGCEKNCMFTRDRHKERPNCFGFKFGQGVLEPSDFLYHPVEHGCLDCVHNHACTNETLQRWGEPEMELEALKMEDVSLVEITKDLTVAMISDPKREKGLNVKATFKELFETVTECFKKEVALKAGLEDQLGE